MIMFTANGHSCQSLKKKDYICLQAVRPCNDIFDFPCWWRNSFHNCCELFELQKTCYGYCYSFNSDVSEYSKRYIIIYFTYTNRINTDHLVAEIFNQKQIILYTVVHKNRHDTYLQRKIIQYIYCFRCFHL